MTEELTTRIQTSLGSGYSVERELGGGGMSRTYVAVERSLGRRVVVKMLSPELVAGVSIERFKREILLAAQLQHPHVVPVLSAGEAGGLPWFTMPYVEGESLRHRLARGPLATGEAISILRDVARALAFAHSHGVVHRDIKPDNVLLSQGSATVTDFGIARAITAARKEEAGGTLTMAGTSIGTPAYMAPEQAAGDDVDQRSDLYAFGCVAFEVLAGRPPFQASSAARLIAAQMSETPRNIRELRPDTPELLAALVMQCLAKDPAARPQQAADLVRVLDSVTSSGNTATAPAVLAGRIHVGRALALWAASSALVALTAWAATVVIGLPDWVLPGAIGVMLAGLPIIALTAWVQRVVHQQYTQTPTITPGGGVQTTGAGTLHTLAIKASPHVSWRRTWMGGALAVGSFTVLVIGWMVLRALGIGPAGSLLGAGKLAANDHIIITDFASPGDSTLGLTVTEALRADLSESSVLRVLPRLSVVEVLRLMQRNTSTRLDFELARSIATREGLKAVLDGDVVSLGGRFVLSARLVSASDGSELAAFKEEAASENDLIPAIGRLGRQLRAKSGESLRSVRSAGALDRVTTGSMEALRKYAEANVTFERTGDYDTAIRLLRDAVTIDSTFAMASRRLAQYSFNTGNIDAARDAIVLAYRHSDRLSEVERHLTIAGYHSIGPTRNQQKALDAYDAVIARDSLNFIALNNAALIFGTRRDSWERALQYHLRAAVPAGTSPLSFGNAISAAISYGGQERVVDSLRREFIRRFPSYPNAILAEARISAARGDPEAADSIAALVSGRMMASRASGNILLTFRSDLALVRGEVRQALQLRAQVRDRQTRAGLTLPQGVLASGLDSVFAVAEQYEDLPRARAMLDRLLRRAPIDSIAPLSRNWPVYLYAAALVRDTVRARRFHTEARAQRAAVGVSIADAANAAAEDAVLAWGLGRDSEALRHLDEADRQGHARPDMLARFRFLAHDRIGSADSAIAWGETYLRTPHWAKLAQDAAFHAPLRQRMGELYEAKGDAAKALEHYEAFVSRWRTADAELQPRVQDVRRRIERLRRSRG